MKNVEKPKFDLETKKMILLNMVSDMKDDILKDSDLYEKIMTLLTVSVKNEVVKAKRGRPRKEPAPAPVPEKEPEQGKPAVECFRYKYSDVLGEQNINKIISINFNNTIYGYSKKGGRCYIFENGKKIFLDTLDGEEAGCSTEKICDSSMVARFLYHYCHNTSNTSTPVRNINLRDVGFNRREVLSMIAFGEFEYSTIEGVENNCPYTLSILKVKMKGIDTVNIIRVDQSVIIGLEKKVNTKYLKLTDTEFESFKKVNSNIFKEENNLVLA
jgi:hypothetical protein